MKGTAAAILSQYLAAESVEYQSALQAMLDFAIALQAPRPCLFIEEIDDEIDFTHAKQGKFHLWGVSDGETVGVVSGTDGACKVVPVPFIKFL